MPSVLRETRTEGSTTFAPDVYFEEWRKGALSPPDKATNFRAFVLKAFALTPQDDYIYRAGAEVTLSQAQQYLETGAEKGFHAWYRDAEAEKVSSSNDLRLATINHSPKL
jgi:hypothetical protein